MSNTQNQTPKEIDEAVAKRIAELEKLDAAERKATEAKAKQVESLEAKAKKMAEAAAKAAEAVEAAKAAPIVVKNGPSWLVAGLIATGTALGGFAGGYLLGAAAE